MLFCVLGLHLLLRFYTLRTCRLYRSSYSVGYVSLKTLNKTLCSAAEPPLNCRHGGQWTTVVLVVCAVMWCTSSAISRRVKLRSLSVSTTKLALRRLLSSGTYSRPFDGGHEIKRMAYVQQQCAVMRSVQNSDARCMIMTRARHGVLATSCTCM